LSESKLIIDSDWKSQAQAEKEKLAQKTAPKAAPGAEGEEREVGFPDVVGMLAQNALAYLGYIPDPETGQAMVSLEYAKLHIDLLGVLEVKTRGNLDGAELQALTKTLTQLRAAFVEVSQAVAKAVAEGRIKPRGGGGGGVAGPIGGPSAGGPSLVFPG